LLNNQWVTDEIKDEIKIQWVTDEINDEIKMFWKLMKMKT
jgi:hypothetical protein